MSKFILWGVMASPYLLKMQSLLAYAQHEWQRWPAQAGRLSATRMAWRLNQAKRQGLVQRYPGYPSALEEYPSVPFYTEDGRTFYYDSTALALHLDEHPKRHDRALLPASGQLNFVCRLLDEAFDEFGLYMVHHMRWVGSARTTPMGEMTAKEFGSVLLPGMGLGMARKLPQRQVRRCPYLLSVAPEGFDAGVSAELTPPAREGFPATHNILSTAWRLHLAAMESLLESQPYLLGERFTLADASAYGQLSMNLVDGDAAVLLEKLAPRTHRWLCGIRDGAHVGSEGTLSLTPALQPLLQIVLRTFVPLMMQNAAAHKQALLEGETLFNEAGFNRGRAVYDGSLLQQPFRAGVKTFQVQVWRDLATQWQALPESDREQLQREYLPGMAACFSEALKR